MPSLFRRKSTDLIEDGLAAVSPEPGEEIEPVSPANRPKGYTPSKRELGLATPKRTGAAKRVAEPPPANRREAYKRMREKQRAERAEAAAGVRAGDERYLPKRDQGPERALVRDMVDSRRSVGNWFFVAAFLMIVTSSSVVPPAVRVGANVAYTALILATIVDSVFVCRRVKSTVFQRYPSSKERPGSLYWYAIMRSLAFRRMRVPGPRVKVGAKI